MASACAEAEFLRTPEAAALLRFDGDKAVKQFFAWADRYAVPRLHRGRVVLWERRVLLDFLAGKAWTKERPERHEPKVTKVHGATLPN